MDDARELFLMTDWPILSTVTFLPLVGALLILLIKDDSEASRRNIRNVALLTTIFVFALSLVVWAGFDNSNPGFQMVEQVDWMGGGISYHMGVDGISVLFVVLSAFLMPFCILASWVSVEKRVKEYMIAFLILETLMIGVFCALDLFLFYVFFEASLIPMFIIIGVWGGKRRVYASLKFFLYTLLGSVLMLIAIMAMYWQAGTMNIVELLKYDFPAGMQTWLWLAFFASFAVKMPMWPVHTWLPDAHVEAPTAGSVILAGILLKLGGYGFIRFSLPMFPLASADFAPFIFALSVIAIIYTSLVAMVQEDMKKLIAYSSVAHMAYVTMGIFAANEQGLQGAIFQMLSHGIVSGALFLCVGVIYDRMHTREIAAFGGLVNNMPKYAVAFLIFTMANVGLPGTSGFIGEFLTLFGVFRVNTWVALFATTGVILSAAYALWLYRQVIFGALTKESLKALLDLSPREKLILYPLVVLTIFFGVYPTPVFNVTAGAVNALVQHYDAALAGSASAVLAQ
ncbi:proton-translocating NADH-quinone oxidoreductase, chain M [Brucella intermedia LMG 3301]|nr:proton-translocating NADH-quinone oxidoreductase, chain M [Brucella intermedia LMG 3301]